MSAPWANDLRRRLLAVAVATAGALMCLILGSAWIVGTVWNTSWRNPVLASLLGGFLLVAILGTALGARPFRPGQEPFARLPGESGATGAFPRSIVMRLLLHWTGLARILE
jgi:hypothetical protein